MWYLFLAVIGEVIMNSASLTSAQRTVVSSRMTGQLPATVTNSQKILNSSTSAATLKVTTVHRQLSTQLTTTLKIKVARMASPTNATMPPSNTNRSSRNGTMYAVRVTSDRNELPTLKSPKDELLIIGQDVNKISKVWLHPSPACDVQKDNRAVEMTISQTSTTFIVTHLTKEEKYRDEWHYPIFVCTSPSTLPSEFQTVIIEDNRPLLLPLLCVIYCFFMLLSALFTGLNLSLMSLDLDDLRRIKDYDENPKTRRHAANIIPIRENGNFILCTILLGNTICNTICVLTFDRIFAHVDMSDLYRVIFINIVPSMFTVTFSEVIPQVVFTKYALSMGSRFRYLMVFFIVLTFPASYPLSKLLDLIVGKEMRMSMDKRILSGLIRQQKYTNENMAEVVENAMNLQVRRVRDVMTPLEKVFMISDKTEVNSQLKRQLSENRHTRIPIYKDENRNCIVGILNVKDLLLIDDSLDIRVGMIMQLWHRSTMFRFVRGETPVAQLMLELKKGFPLAIVVDYHHDKMSYTVIGIVTLEDNLEEVIGEIYDEKDVKLKDRSEELGMETQMSIRKSTEKPLKMSKMKRGVPKSGEDVVADEYTPLLPQGSSTTHRK